jgi:hypothetical protein
MDGKKQNPAESIIRKMLLMALIERMEAGLQRNEAEEKAFVRLEGKDARFEICLN